MPLLASYLTKDLTESDRLAINAILHQGIKSDNTLILDPNVVVAKTGGAISKAVIDGLLLRVIMPSVLETAPKPMLASDMCTAVKSQTLFSAVSSGWTSIDHILGEIGYKAGEVNEICGAAGVGKTQMCLKAAISLLQKHESSRVVWIETSDDHRLSSEKAYEMAAVHLKSLHRESEGDAQSYDGSLDVKKVTSVLGRIIIHECSGIKSLFNLLDNIHQIHDELAQVNADSPPMLIVVDSLSTVLTDHLWATDGSGHALVMQISRQLRALAQDLNLVVLVTTTAVLSSSSEEQNLSILISSKFKPGLGSCWKFATDLQLYVTRVETPPSQWQDPMLQLNPILPTSKLNTRVIEITRSRRLKIGEWTVFAINRP